MALCLPLPPAHVCMRVSMRVYTPLIVDFYNWLIYVLLPLLTFLLNPLISVLSMVLSCLCEGSFVLSQVVVFGLVCGLNLAF